jgi:hypothetical protein
VQALLECRAHCVQVQLSRSIGQRSAVENGERRNVHRQSVVLDTEIADVKRAQPLQPVSHLKQLWARRLT